MTRGLRGRGVLQLIERCLREGTPIEIDGVGSFDLDDEKQLRFEPSGRTRVFLAYAEYDRAEVRRLYKALRAAGFDAWMDEEKLLPGQNWPRAIERAIETSDFFLGCFSRRSASRRGYFHCELRCALDLASQVPLDDVFLVPVRLDDCALPRPISQRTQFVDLFPDWEAGVARLVQMIEGQMRLRKSSERLAG